MNNIPPITILLYHDLVDVGDPCQKGCISISLFVEHMRELKRHGFRITTLEDGFNCLGGAAGETPSGQCVVTFDDAFDGLYRFLPTVLQELDGKATVFVITDYVGQSNLWNTRASAVRRHMSVDMLLELQDRGVALELHGADHHNLLKFSTDELNARFNAGISWFENVLRRRPKYLAYPYGAFNATVATAASRHFEGALSVNHGKWWGSDSVFGLNRISVPHYLSGRDLLDVVLTAPGDRWIVTEQKAPWKRL